IYLYSRPWNIRHHRPAARGDENIASGYLFAVDCDRVGIENLGVAFDDLDAGGAENFSVNIVEPADLAIFVGDQLRPVDLAFADGPAIAGCIFEVFAEVRGINQKLLGNTAYIHAGAAEITFLCDRHFGAEGCRHPARAHAAGAGTDGKYIVVVLGHASLPSALDFGSIQKVALVRPKVLSLFDSGGGFMNNGRT